MVVRFSKGNIFTSKYDPIQKMKKNDIMKRVVEERI